MIDYMVLDTLWNEYTRFATEEDARKYVKICLEDDEASAKTDFVIFKRERLD